MPFINAKFSVPVSHEQEIELKSALGEAITLLGKPERYLMVEIEDNRRLYFGGDNSAPIAFFDVSLLHSAPRASYEKLTARLCEIAKDTMDVDGLSANDYNPNVVYSPELRLLRFSLLRQGWIQPVLVTKDGTIIDGFHRASLVKTDKEVRALTKGKVPCVEMDLDEADRMLLTIRINRAKGSHIALKMADIIKTLVNDHGLTLDEICNQIGATKDEVDLLLMENVFKAKGIDEKTPFSRAWIPAVKGGRRLGGVAGAQKPAQTRKSGIRGRRKRT